METGKVPESANAPSAVPPVSDSDTKEEFTREGISAAPGIVIGTAFVLDHEKLSAPEETIRAQDTENEIARFREALEIYPDYVGSGNPYLGLATVYRERADEARLIDILEQFLRISEYGPAEARELGALYADADDTDQALAYLARSLEVEPYDLPTRDRLAVLYEQQGRYAQVVQQRRAILALNPVDKANAYYELARSLYNTHDVAAAKRAVLQSLERAPGYRQAQKLLLDCVDNRP